MNISVMQENLARGLGVVSRAVSSRATLPVLANVLLKTEDAGLKLTATNLEIGINCWVPGKVERGGRDHGAGQAAHRPGRVAAEPAHRPGALAQGPDPEGHLRQQPARASRASRRTSSRWWPPSARRRPRASTARVLREALGEVVFAAASDESRPILTGVLTRLTGDTMTLAAADNYRIAVRTGRARQAGVAGDGDRRAGAARTRS